MAVIKAYPSRQPLSDRRRARAKVLAARSARRRQVLPAAPCSVSTIRVETRALRRPATGCMTSRTRSAVPKPALTWPSVHNTSSGCDGCFLLSIGSGLHTIRRSTSETFSHGVSFFSAKHSDEENVGGSPEVGRPPGCMVRRCWAMCSSEVVCRRCSAPALAETWRLPYSCTLLPRL